MLSLRTTLSALALTLLASQGVNAQNLDCTLEVPANPLTAQGLMTPYILAGNNPPITTGAGSVAGQCNQATFIQRTFVQGAILDPATGAITLYDPLVIDAGTKPAAAVAQATVPAGAVVGIWFGNNANTLTLKETINPGALAAGKCVNGLTVNGKVDLFGEFAYCNAPAWFKAANAAIAAGKITIPNLGTYNVPAGANTPVNPAAAKANFVPTKVAAQQNIPCPTVRAFAVIDQDQSDNMVTSYLLTANGATAQDSPANRAALKFGQNGGAVQIVNASDNRLVSVALDTAFGCKPMVAQDQVSGQMIPSFPLNELMAAAKQAAPRALVPANDPMVQTGNQQANANPQASLAKVNLYRAAVNQNPANNLAKIAGTAYCLQFGLAAANRIIQDSPLTIKAGSPVPTVGDTLFTFMTARMNGAWTILTCDVLLKAPVPFITVTAADGQGNDVVVAANLDPKFPAALAAFQKNAAAMAAAAKKAAATAKAAAATAATAKAAAKAAAAAKTPKAAAAATAAQAAAIQKVQAAIASNNPADLQAAIAALQAAAANTAALQANLAAAQTTATVDSAELNLEVEEVEEADVFDAIASTDIPDLDYFAESDAFDAVPLIPDTPTDAAPADAAAAPEFSADFTAPLEDDASNAPAADGGFLFEDPAVAALAAINSAEMPATACPPAAEVTNNGFSGLWFGVGAASMFGLVSVVGSGLALARRKMPGFAPASGETHNMQSIHATQSDSV